MMRKFKFYLMTILMAVVCSNAYAQISKTNEVPPKTLSKLDKDSIQIKLSFH